LNVGRRLQVEGLVGEKYNFKFDSFRKEGSEASED